MCHNVTPFGVLGRYQGLSVRQNFSVPGAASLIVNVLRCTQDAPHREWWKTLLFALAVAGAIWVMANLFKDDDDNVEPEKASVYQTVGTAGLLIALAIAMGVAYSAFTATAAEALTVETGTGFRPAYDVEILSDSPAGYWRLGDTITGGGTFTDDFTVFSGWTTFGSGDVQAAIGIQPDGTSGRTPGEDHQQRPQRWLEGPRDVSR